MRSTFVIIVFFLLCFVGPGMASGKERLAVLDLEPKYGIDGGLAEALSMIVRDEIHYFGKYSVLSRDDLRAVTTREQLLQAMGCDDGNSCLVDFGRAIGTRFMVVGAVSKIGKTYSINLRLLDTKGENAGLVKRVSARCQCSDEDLINTIQTVSAELLGVEKTKAVVEDKSQPKKTAQRLCHEDEFTSWMSAVAYQREFDNQVKRKRYPKVVEGKCSFTPQFRACFERFPRGKFWFMSHQGLSEIAFDAKEKKYLKQDFSTIFKQSFECNGKSYNQGTWVKQP